MNKVLIALVALCTSVALANAGEPYTDLQFYSQGGPRLESYAVDNGIFKLFIVSKDYAEGYIGVSQALVPWLEVELGVGIETSENLWRMGSAVWLGAGKISNFTILETGASGFWYRNHTKFQVAKMVGLGMFAQKNDGLGPRVDVIIPKTKLALWGAYLFHPQTTVLTLKCNF